MKDTAAFSRLRDNNGFSLVELAIVVVIIGILLAVAMRSMTAIVQDRRLVKTEREMEALAAAIVGNPSLHSGGARSDFGYVGDIGAFPPNLDALLSKPGGYTTWDGPYIALVTGDSVGYSRDEWGLPYDYSGGNAIISTGSGTSIVRKLADDPADYLYNTMSGQISDAADSLPGPLFCDSIDIRITIPDGAGGTTARSVHPNAGGYFSLDSLPAGRHSLSIAYTPTADTLRRSLTVLPRHRSNPPVLYRFGGYHFSTLAGPSPTDSVLTLVTGSPSISGAQCNVIQFSIENNTGADVTVNSIVVSWTGPTAYYRYVRWDGETLVNSSNPKFASGQTATFSHAVTIPDGDQAAVQISDFRSGLSGGSRVNMSGAAFTIALSDGSTVNFSVGTCP